jgi:chromatin assembly factor 1 subunit A
VGDLEQTNELKKQQEQEEKEQKRNERESMEVEKDRKKKERDLKRQQDEADKEQRRKERELKRQQEEAEKEQKRKEKEAAERKKQLVIQKQATIMDKLFRRKEPETPAAQPQGADMSRQSLSPLEHSPESSTCSTDGIQMIIAHMDQELTAFQSRNAEELMRLLSFPTFSLLPLLCSVFALAFTFPVGCDEDSPK